MKAALLWRTPTKWKKKEMEKRATFLFSLFALDYQIWLL